MLKGKRIACVLSTSLLLSTYSTHQTPFRTLATEVVKNDNFEMVQDLRLKTNYEQFIDKYEKDKTESERKKAEELKRQRLIEEQKYKDLHPHYNPYDLREISGISVQRIYDLLSGTTYQTWDNAQAFYNSEKLQPSVNALFLIGLCNFESYYGKSGLARENNNIVSWRLNNGWRSFNSKTECINETAKLISNEYLNPKGKFYNGVDLWSVGKLYCEDSVWSGKVNEMVNELLSKK